MRRVLVALSLVASFAFAATFDDGMSAYNKGDYKTAFTIWQDLANKGNTKAQYGIGIMYNDGEGVRQENKWGVIIIKS